ncbi:L-serine ammonia-lyase, iron-sulfur-dependent, subunit alpha [Gottschalkiaceae bacterium SANA]|nr:L-serine ammonia-lyase, iron-sulfur-dependent, subunit alpha [Gottschalkiaceae bacterium SANA]
MNVKNYPDFFNNVFGPIMQPGSSTHTAGPARMGYMCNSLLGEEDEVSEILAIMDPDGSFCGTFGMMTEDLGILTGALGHLPDWEFLFEAKEVCEEKGVKFNFSFSDMKESTHPNAIKFVLKGKSGRVVSLVANSTGGGMIETVIVNDYPFHSIGESFVICVFDKEDKLEGSELERSMIEKFDIYAHDISRAESKGKMLWFRTSYNPDKKEIKNVVGDLEFSVMYPVLPVVTRREKKEQLFNTVEGMRKLAESQNKRMSEIAIEYEMNSSCWSREDVIEYMEKTVAATMHRRTHAIYEEEMESFYRPYLTDYYKMYEEFRVNKGNDLLAGPTIGLAYKYLLGGKPFVPGLLYVPGPQGSGGGYVYAALSAVKEIHGYSNEDLLRGLFVAAAVGSTAYSNCDPTAEAIGCAGDAGMVCSFIAAGLTEMMGGTPKQVEWACSLALQSFIGIVCDYFPGGDENPCQSRMFVAVGMGIVFSELATVGINPVIPFHEVVDTAASVGSKIPSDLRCTARGGLCLTPTALKLKNLNQIALEELEKSKNK